MSKNDGRTVKEYEAGIDLDVLIAEQVTGFEIMQPMGDHYVTEDMASDAGCPEMAGSHHSTEYGPVQPPPYSTDIKAAWEVVKIIRNKPFSIRFKFMEALQPHRVNIEPFWHFIILDNQPAMTICNAALKAFRPTKKPENNS